MFYDSYELLVLYIDANLHVYKEKKVGTMSLYKFGLNWSLNLQENNEQKKTPLLHYCVCFQMHNKKLQLKYFIWVRNYLFLKNHVSSQRESFLTMFYTFNHVNRSLLLVTKSGFTLCWQLHVNLVKIPILLSTFKNEVFCFSVSLDEWHGLASVLIKGSGHFW